MLTLKYYFSVTKILSVFYLISLKYGNPSFFSLDDKEKMLKT